MGVDFGKGLVFSALVFAAVFTFNISRFYATAGAAAETAQTMAVLAGDPLIRSERMLSIVRRPADYCCRLLTFALSHYFGRMAGWLKWFYLRQ
jgi:hypothetical protein